MRVPEEGTWERDYYNELTHQDQKPYNELLFDSGYRSPSVEKVDKEKILADNFAKCKAARRKQYVKKLILRAKINIAWKKMVENRGVENEL